MFYLKKILAYELLVILIIVGCSDSSHKATADDNNFNNKTAKETASQNYVEIGFSQGSAVLTDSAKISLNSIIKQARQEDKADEVIVLSWSDKEYPSKRLKKLSKPQRELATKRNRNISKYVKSMKNIEIKTFNMAERPTAYSKLFETEDSRLKESLVSAGLSTTADSGNYMSKASRAVILLKTK
jgi:PBP1b-binding outer membrane lipoprotein LpoB